MSKEIYRKNKKTIAPDWAKKLSVVAAVLLLGWLLIFSFLSGPYQIVVRGGGVYRLNEKSGEILLLDGLNLRELTRVSKPVLKNTLIKWPEDDIVSGKMQVNVKTTWRDGMLYYNFVLTPALDKFNKIKESHSGTLIFLSFQDADGFEMVQVPIRADSLISTRDTDGQTGGYTMQGKEPCSYEVYAVLKNMSSAWNFEI